MWIHFLIIWINLEQDHFWERFKYFFLCSYAPNLILIIDSVNLWSAIIRLQFRIKKKIKMLWNGSYWNFQPIQTQNVKYSACRRQNMDNKSFYRLENEQKKIRKNHIFYCLMLKWRWVKEDIYDASQQASKQKKKFKVGKGEKRR